MRVAALPRVDHHVDIGIDADVLASARADLQTHGRRRRFVDDLMPVRNILRKTRTISRAQGLLALVSNQRHFAGDDIDELILRRMPRLGSDPRVDSPRVRLNWASSLDWISARSVLLTPIARLPPPAPRRKLAC